jgi:hypothetical protein
MKTPERQVFSLVGNFKALGGLKGLQIFDAFLLEIQKPQLVERQNCFLDLGSLSLIVRLRVD